MKKIINNKMYDTSTAKEIGGMEHSNRGDFSYFSETLFRKRTGEYFLYGKGGPMSRYSRTVGQNEWSSGERIIPLNYEKARKWAEENLDADDYQKEFGEVSEEDERTVLSVSLDVGTAERIRKLAAENNTSVSALIASKFAITKEEK